MEKFAPLNLTRDEMIEYTREWEGERFPDGRPKVSDDIIERMKSVSVTQAWGTLRGHGYQWQYEGNWKCTHPDGVLVGRALTAVYMPTATSNANFDGREGGAVWLRRRPNLLAH